MELYSFGMGVGVACLAGGVVGRALARRRGLSSETWWWLVTGLMVSGVAGARLIHILPDAGYYIQYPYEIIRPPIEGLSYYGALLFGAFYIRFFARRARMSFWQVADLVALPWLVVLLWVAVLWGAPVAKVGAPDSVRIILDLVYLTGVYVLIPWVQREARRPSNHGQPAMAVLALDGFLRLVTGWGFARYLPATVPAPLVDHLSRAGAFLVGAVLLWAVRGATRTRSPLDYAASRGLSRWLGWLVAYIALAVIKIATA